MHTTKDPHGHELETVVIVAFDRASGEVRGTYMHSSFRGARDDAAVRRRNTLRFVNELAGPAGAQAVDTVELAADQLRGRVVIQQGLHSLGEANPQRGCVVRFWPIADIHLRATLLLTSRSSGSALAHNQ